MLDLQHPITLLRPREIRFGAGTLCRLREFVAARGGRAYVVTDTFNAARVDLLDLDNPVVFGEIASEPEIPDLEAALARAEAAFGDAPAVVVGFGGGSAMDLAKLVAVLAGSGRSLTDISGADRAPARRAALVQIPTTAGTGSEVGTRALITDPETRNKVATESPQMLADLAIVDPGLTASAPPFVTAATGVDAMAHCVEALTSKRAHPLIDAYALEGIRLVGRYLKRAVDEGDDIEARTGLSLAALYGGVCLGPVNTTAGHALSYPLGTHHNIAHGIANALIFPHTLEANAPATPGKTAQVITALGGSEGAAPFEVAYSFCDAMGIDMRLGSYGVGEDSLDEMAREAHGIRRLLDWNPRDLTVHDITEIYRRAF
ncbi:iron-containing alcohol dehydrogenase [Tropicimonas sp.]|uniref:iron-containing alcohol dehydrogenase n=1 Tax=Tropicimonas sp. TaxID=2067044 RepID=UPI003A8A26C4